MLNIKSGSRQIIWGIEYIMPKTFGNLWQGVIDYSNLHKAYLKARKSKRYSSDIVKFTFGLEENLIDIQNRLIWKQYEIDAYREFYVCDPKKRLIHAPSFRDRVVHHALVTIIEPLFEKKFIADSFACRRGKGTHRAVCRALDFARKAEVDFCDAYVLKCDVSKYFPSVNHRTLKEVIRRTIRDKEVLWLIDKIIERGNGSDCGLPIGALTSQLFANIYLNEIDHFIKDSLGMKYYVRYMDDFVVYGEKRRLRDLYFEIQNFLRTKLALQFNSKTQIFKLTQGIDFCGYRIWTTHVLPRKRTVKRAKKRFKLFAKLYKYRKISLGKARSGIMSFMGYMKYCNGHRTTMSILGKIILSRE